MAKQEKGPAKPEIDITPSYPAYDGDNPPWPYTRPDPRPFGYKANHKKTVRLLVLPGHLPYDPAMNAIETTVRKMMERDYNVEIVVPDCYRGIGEIMARRNGLDYKVVHTALRDSINLPGNHELSTLMKSKVARKRIIASCDRAAVVLNNPITEFLLEELLADAKVQVKTYKPVFKTKKRKPAPMVETKPKKKKRKS